MKTVFLDKRNFQTSKEEFDYSPFRFCDKFIAHEETSESEIYDRARNADVLIVLKTALSSNILSQLKNLKLICKIGTGYDKIDVKAAKSYGIAVTNFPGHAANMVAQWTISLLLTLAGQIIQYDKSVKAHQWQESQFNYEIFDINRKTLGIIGYGSIGKLVSKLARKLGMKVLVNSKYPDNNPDVRFVDKKEIYQNADFISLHCILDESTEGMINTSIFDLMNPSTYLINTARARLVNKHDLFLALKHNQIAGAAFDGFWKEPPDKNDPILSLSNLIVTPHVGWSSKEARQSLLNHIAARIENFSQGIPITIL